MRKEFLEKVNSCFTKISSEFGQVVFICLKFSLVDIYIDEHTMSISFMLFPSFLEKKKFRLRNTRLIGGGLGKHKKKSIM